MNKEIKRVKEAITLDADSLTSILPYRYYDTNTDLFINENSLGFGFELSLFSGVEEQTINALSSLLRDRLPDKYELMFLFWSNQKIGPMVDASYADQLANGGVFERLASASIQYYKKAAVDGFYNPRGLPLLLRDYRLFCFVSKKTTYSQVVETEIINARGDLESELSSNQFYFSRIDIHPFLSLLRSMINPDPQNLYPSSSSYQEQELIHEQIADRSLNLTIHPDYLTMDRETFSNDSAEACRTSSYVVNLSLNKLPNEFKLWMVPDNFSNIFRVTKSIRCPFLISMTMRMMPSASAKNMAKSRFLSFEKKANSVYAKYITGTTEAAEEWKKTRDELDSDEIRLAQTYFNVLLFSTEEHWKRDRADAMASFRYNGIELFSTKYLHMQSFLATLPFMVSEGLYEDLLRFQRFRKLTTWNLANLLPLVSDPKISFQGAIFPSFRHQLSMLDIFNAPGITNYNMAVAAASGAGKTFLIQMLVLMMLSRAGKVWAIDLGDSYQKSCQIFNGTYLTADNLKLNPFSIVINIEESLEQIADLYAIMASPTETMGDVKKAYLMEAIKNAFFKKEQRTKVDHVVEELQTIAKRENEDRRAYDLVTVLKKYMTDGPDGVVFNEASELAPNASFVVLELGGLKNKPTLLKSVLFALILSIQNEMYRSNFKGKKMCIIDEAWEFLGGNNKEAADFIERGYRTSRKHNGSFVTITQAVRDYLRSEESHAAWNNSDIKIIMRQDAKAFETFIKENADFYTPYQQTLIRSFRPAKENGFSEFMLCLGGQSSFHRLFVDPFSRIMFSSAKNEVDAVRALEEQGIPLFEAIERVAKQVFPEEMI